MPTDAPSDTTAVHDPHPNAGSELEAGLGLALRAEDSGDWRPLVAWLAANPRFAVEVATFVKDSTEIPRPPTGRIGGYELLDQIGRGGMGVVYRARDHNLNRDVAVKLLRAEGGFTTVEAARLRYEAEVVASLSHPNIVQVLSFGEADAGPYLVMPLMAASLKDHGANRQLAPMVAAEIVRVIAQGVHHAHQRGLIHRDLKPANILLDATGTPHVADFGLARRTDATATTAGGIAGTVAYMAPEQGRGEKQLTTAVDVYALGVVLFELLTGRVPYAGLDAAGILLRLIDEHEPVPPVRQFRPDVPADLAAVCAKCLEKRPADRYRSAQELADDLTNFIEERPVTARPPGFWDWLRQLSRIRPPDSYATPFWPVTAWFGVLILLTNVATYGLVWADGPAAGVWAANALGGVVQFGVLWWYMLRRFRLVPLIDRHSFILAVGCTFLYFPLTAAYVPLSWSASARDGLGVFPAFAGITALGLFTVGSTNWSRFFPIGFGMMCLIPFLARWPNEAPLLYGTALASALWYWSYFSAFAFHRTSADRDDLGPRPPPTGAPGSDEESTASP